MVVKVFNMQIAVTVIMMNMEMIVIAMYTAWGIRRRQTQKKSQILK